MTGYRVSWRGTALIVHDVEIFAENKKGDRVIDAAWIDHAVASAKVDESEGYLPPLHIRHHDDYEQVEHAGHFRITGTKRITFQGNSIVAVIADLIITNPKVQEQFEAGALPYRSAEVFSFENPRLDTLALLDHEPPFFRFPLLAPEGRSVADATFHRGRLVDGEGVISSVAKGKATRVLFRSAEAPMTQTHKKPDPKTGAKPAAESKPKPEAKFEADGEKKDDGDDGEGEKNSEDLEAADVSKIVGMIKDGSISVADMQLIMEAIDEMTAASNPQAPAAEEPAMAAAPGGALMKQPRGKESQEFAKLRGELDAMKAREASRDEAEKCSADVRNALQRLTGRALPSDAETLFREFRKKHGAQAFMDYIDGFESSVGYAPDDSASMARFASHAPRAVSEAALKYQDHGPHVVEEAMRLEREWEQLASTGMKTTKENYITRRLGLADKEKAK